LWKKGLLRCCLATILTAIGEISTAHQGDTTNSQESQASLAPDKDGKEKGEYLTAGRDHSKLKRHLGSRQCN
jgi:hypothetical protein